MFVVLAVVALGCSKPAKAKPPPSLLSAVAAADAAVSSNGAVQSSCETLARELTNFEQSPTVPIPQKADLHRLMMEVAAYGATEDNGPMARPADVGRWKAIRAQLDRVLAGENPTPGPRYQIDMPPEVKDALAAAHAALDAGNVDEGGKALMRLRSAIDEWAQKMPGPRGARMMQAVEQQTMLLGSGDRLADLKDQLAKLEEAIRPR